MTRSAVPLALALLIAGCTDEGDGAPSDTDEAPHVVDPVAAGRAFKLYYRERTERVLLSFERFGAFGDTSFAVVNGRADVSRSGDTWEIVPGPKDNNLVGTSVQSLWAAYKVFGGRPLELALIRHFQGLAWQEAMTGIPGMTNREALPGWTRVIDGAAGTQTRTRDGAPITRPAPDVDIHDEVLATFFADGTWTYREDPHETFFSHLPVADLESYAITMSFPDPRFLRVSDCCSSFMRVPDGRPWAGAYWGNHNSRDNLPDLMLGHLAAQAAAADPDVPDDVRRAAEAAVAAGERVADLVMANGNTVMTVDEFHDDDTLVPSGGIRPHGLSEGQDLGTLEACPNVFLTATLATGGLTYPPPDLPMSPGIEELLLDAVGSGGISCTIETPRTCSGLEDAFCGYTWSTMEEIEIFGQPLLELAKNLGPATAAGLLGSLQNDYDDVVEAMTGVVQHARNVGDKDMEADARLQARAMTDTMRAFADVIFTPDDPGRAEQRYEAAVFDAIVGADVIPEDLGDLSIEESRVAGIEQLLVLGDTSPWPLVDDATILARVNAELVALGNHPSGRSDVIRDRYADAYGDQPPLRRAGEAYEARTAESGWHAVENPRHTRVGGLELWQALPICLSRPDLLDCAWAARGCKPADLDGDGVVTTADRAALDGIFVDGKTCGADGCGGADIDGSGTLDALDTAFEDAAIGCWYTP